MEMCRCGKAEAQEETGLCFSCEEAILREYEDRNLSFDEVFLMVEGEQPYEGTDAVFAYDYGEAAR